MKLEQLTVNRFVAGSSPARGAIKINRLYQNSSVKTGLAALLDNAEDNITRISLSDMSAAPAIDDTRPKPDGKT